LLQSACSTVQPGLLVSITINPTSLLLFICSTGHYWLPVKASTRSKGKLDHLDLSLA